jgi:tetratricopeptide (TPR) repeat protein
VACLYTIFSLLHPATEVNHSGTQNGLQSFPPAMSAYSKGAVALEKGEMAKAEKWLRFSLAENPASIDTQLLLAESLLQQNKLTESESLAQSVMQVSDGFAYSTSAAAQLLSRIYQQQGSVYNALEYAIRGSKEVDSTQAICTAEALHLRIQVLSELLDSQSGLVTLSNSIQRPTADFGGLLISNAVLPETDRSDPSDQFKKCARLKKSLPDEDLSNCFEPPTEWYLTPKYAAKEQLFYFSGRA